MDRLPERSVAVKMFVCILTQPFAEVHSSVDKGMLKGPHSEEFSSIGWNADRLDCGWFGREDHAQGSVACLPYRSSCVHLRACPADSVAECDTVLDLESCLSGRSVTA